MISSETLNCIALTLLPRIRPLHVLELYRAAGSATAIVENRRDLQAIAPQAAPVMAEVLALLDTALQRAGAEAEFVEKHGVRCLSISDSAYPARLRGCADAPLVLFCKGNAGLNPRRAVSVVGTRRCTEYGKDLCERLVRELAAIAPGTLVISGLAYGIDVLAHRTALAAGLPTLAVLAHGLDTLYPAVHRATAREMTGSGGLATEFVSGTVPDKKNFVRRNRIIAGLADAVVVVESAAKGGGLITASIAQSYNREVCAFPGRTTDEYSRGCNNLIRTNRAQMITSAEDLAEALGWRDVAEKAACAPQQRSLFKELSADEELVAKALAGSDGMQLNTLASETGMPVGKLMSLLFEMEMRGAVKSMSGTRYRLR